MAQNFKELLISFAIIGLVVFSLIAFVFTSQSDNGVSDSLANNNLFSRTYSNLSGNLMGMRSQSETQRSLFETENPTVGFGEITFLSIIKIGRSFGEMITGVFNSIILIPYVVFGISPIIMGVLILILIATIIFYLWRSYKTGD